MTVPLFLNLRSSVTSAYRGFAFKTQTILKRRCNRLLILSTRHRRAQVEIFMPRNGHFMPNNRRF